MTKSQRRRNQKHANQEKALTKTSLQSVYLENKIKNQETDGMW
ncbi:MAG: hypothetical protein WCC52_04950 [Nitrosotalea sp.]